MNNEDKQEEDFEAYAPGPRTLGQAILYRAVGPLAYEGGRWLKRRIKKKKEEKNDSN